MQQWLSGVLLYYSSAALLLFFGADAAQLRARVVGNHTSRSSANPMAHAAENPICPGVGAPCSGNGECLEATGVCWCKTGFGSTDCATEVPKVYNVKAVGDPNLQDMKGDFILVPMYLQESRGNPEEVKFIHYDPVSQGWAVSKVHSTCTDDICFFAYAKGQERPPPKGYVFGQPDKHVYYKQLLFDDAEMYPGKLPGYHVSVSYTPDPNAVAVTETLSQFTGRYVLQPRYVHRRTGKYAIMPVTLDSPGKQWYILGLNGVGSQRRWKILGRTTDPSLNRYIVPSGGWQPPALSLNFAPSCNNHLTDEVCMGLEGHCMDTPDSTWVKGCCRDTCNTCAMASNSCTLPRTANSLLAIRHLLNQSSATASNSAGVLRK